MLPVRFSFIYRLRRVLYKSGPDVATIVSIVPTLYIPLQQLRVHPPSLFVSMLSYLCSIRVALGDTRSQSGNKACLTPYIKMPHPFSNTHPYPLHISSLNTQRRIRTDAFLPELVKVDTLLGKQSLICWAACSCFSGPNPPGCEDSYCTISIQR